MWNEVFHGASSSEHSWVVVADRHNSWRLDPRKVETASYVDSLARQFFRNSVGAVDATFD
jgi:hypothetical protein